MLIIYILIIIIIINILINWNIKEHFDDVMLKNNIKYSLLIQDIENNYIRNLNNSIYTKPNYRYYKEKKFKSKYAYVSVLIIDDKYLPSTLALGYTLKKYKCKYDKCIFVQDKPYYIKDNDNNIVNVLPGISNETIEYLKLFYDEIIGFDLIKIDNYKGNLYNFTKHSHYINIQYYVSKLIVLSYIQYEKIFYMDSSIILRKNIDYIFDKYNESTFVLDREYLDYNIGLRGTFYLYIPRKYYYDKALYLINNYDKLFKLNKHNRGIDEFILYFTIYPNWSKKLFDPLMGCYEFKKKKLDCDLYYYQINKPFINNIDNRHNNPKKYETWDLIIKELIEKYPELINVYKYIKEYRETKF